MLIRMHRPVRTRGTISCDDLLISVHAELQVVAGWPSAARICIHLSRSPRLILLHVDEKSLLYPRVYPCSYPAKRGFRLRDR